MFERMSTKQAVVITSALISAASLYAGLSWFRRFRRTSKTYVLRSEFLEIHILELGGIIQRLYVPDISGARSDVVLGFDDVASYMEDSNYFGAVVGRVANRIGAGKFTIDKKVYQLDLNNGKNHLHGGFNGWSKKKWHGVYAKYNGQDAVHMHYTSKNGEEGYPGTVRAEIIYTLKDSMTLEVIFKAVTDAVTPVNMTQHSYFNLAGHDSGNILSHTLRILGNSYTPINENMIPTGSIALVQNSPFDFTFEKAIKKDLSHLDDGYDHNYVLSQDLKDTDNSTEKCTLAAILNEPTSGRSLKISTTAAGLQFYTGNFLNNVKGKNGSIYRKHGGLCLETQGFPNAVNTANFPNVLLRPGEQYIHKVEYQFGVN